MIKLVHKETKLQTLPLRARYRHMPVIPALWGSRGRRINESSRPPWPKLQVPSQPECIVKILFQKNKERKEWGGGGGLLSALIGGGALKKFNQSISNESFAKDN